jgi:hypothetical protein
MLGLTMFILGCGQQQTDPPPNTHFVVGEIRGDTLGMRFKQYLKKYPQCAYSSDLCIDQDSYGGMNARKSTMFFQDHLFFIEYTIKLSGEKEDFLPDLKQKYGQPQRIGKYTWQWSNGKETIDYTGNEQFITIKFYQDDLFSAWSADFDRQKAAKRKSDM